MESEEIILNALLAFFTHFPKFASVVVVIGSLRLFLKPLLSVAQAYVDFTVDPKDNERLSKFLSSKPYKVFAYALDYLASLKLPKV